VKGRIAIVGMVLAATMAAAPGEAQTELTRLYVTTSANAAAAPGGTPSNPTSTVDVYGPPTPAPIRTRVLASDAAIGADAEAGANGEIGFGYFRGGASADAAADPNSLAESFSLVQAASDDWITIVPANPGLIDTLGTVSASVLADGSIDATNSGTAPPPYPASASWSFLAYTDTGQLQGSAGGSFFAGQGLIGDAPGALVVSFNLKLGKLSRMTLVYELRAETRYRFSDFPGGVAHGDALFENTFLWNGIIDVRDAQGQPIAYTLTSKSGVDWTQPVPEPAPGVAGLAAFAGLAVLRQCGRPGCRPGTDSNL